ncbi:Dabb family protein [Chitinasiproducens palmae]|uniref:Stress responsive A/B Barrel Domain n=1 Tax=Chitinasiproducens palmae TaxID=1770053 RepID=A0A1H2PNE6_9BURK|nr:Dabb family protein [Chitinasiproducens palmae]SDV47309.1 Stress responsive A/B Barrel Domain [Chitinasiproducens palmae]
MMKHIVMFRRLPGIEKNEALERELVGRMTTLDQQIDFARDWRVAANELDRPICWDYVLEATFDDAQAVARYLPHPAHAALVADLKQYFEWVAVDYTR